MLFVPEDTIIALNAVWTKDLFVNRVSQVLDQSRGGLLNWLTGRGTCGEKQWWWDKLKPWFCFSLWNVVLLTLDAGRQREQRMKARIMVNSLLLCDDLMTCWHSAWSCTWRRGGRGYQCDISTNILNLQKFRSVSPCWHSVQPISSLHTHNLTFHSFKSKAAHSGRGWSSTMWLAWFLPGCLALS